MELSVRKSWELLPHEFSIANQAEWATAVLVPILRELADTFALGGDGWQLGAELYKLLVYEKGCFFARHRDNERIKHVCFTSLPPIHAPSLHLHLPLALMHLHPHTTPQPHPREGTRLTPSYLRGADVGHARDHAAVCLQRRRAARILSSLHTLRPSSPLASALTQTCFSCVARCTHRPSPATRSPSRTSPRKYEPEPCGRDWALACLSP